MNELLATVFTGLVIDENDQYYFVQKNGITFALSKTEGSYELGAMVEGFGYLNHKQAPEMTTKIPTIRKEQYGFGTVTGTRKDLGAFVDIGLADKDVVVSLDELPTMKELWPKKEDRLMIALKVDQKNRIWGTLADEKEFNGLAKRGHDELKNADMTGTVYRLKLAGSYLLTQDFYLGFVHSSERYQEPRLGEVVKGRVIGIRPDGVLNMSLKPRSYEVIDDDAEMILTFLKRAADHQIPFTDKSDPAAIKQTFGISKAQFKRALGNLIKSKLIKQKNGATLLMKNSEENTSSN